MKRVVITGMGVISPVGNTLDLFWKNLLEGVSGIQRITRVDTEGLKVSLDAEVKDFNPKCYFSSMQEIRRTDLYTRYAVAAAVLAVADSGLAIEEENGERIGVYVGTGIGGIQTTLEEADKLREKGPDRVSPFFIPMMIGNMASGLISIRFGAKGPTLPVTTACATSTHTIGEAARAISRGDADLILAGGAEAAITRLSLAGFQSCQALSLAQNPEEGSLPFDRRRGGFVMGEGAGILVLEEYEHALQRGARIYAEIVGYGNTADACHMTAPDPQGEGAARAVEKAVEEAGIRQEDNIYVNAHGTGTKLNDAMETKALKTVFHDRAKDLQISSTKSMTGHMLGAAGAVEAIASAMALFTGKIPPTIHYQEKDPDCDLNYTPNKAVDFQGDYALSLSLGFGGHNGCLALKKYKEDQNGRN